MLSMLGYLHLPLRTAHSISYLPAVQSTMNHACYNEASEGSALVRITNQHELVFLSDVWNVASRLIRSPRSVNALASMFAVPWEKLRPSQPVLAEFVVDEAGFERQEEVRALFGQQRPILVSSAGIEDWGEFRPEQPGHIFLRSDVSCRAEPQRTIVATADLLS